ncbi:hypothetical protein GPECTOR_29g48 [Gonium pectorale]|uniref:Uncharacterized protein n=1 Tax=Gonium pectorale TaxID=33097 RepID=A0A150GG09_GONPE|nr:hypothetical protein GPECTOR_29g48 [Gonium pectorale]|eukprot:KXZ48270.1 hypothetical protein GPECTOR_29g48 [Gonium pectorale]
MASLRSGELEKDPFQTCGLGSAAHVREFLGLGGDGKDGGVSALRGADHAEDVIGGLQKVAEMLDAERARAAAGGASGSAPQPQRPAPPARNCVLFHICDMPQHGRDFNNFARNAVNDSYPDGPLAPLGTAVPPPGRSRPWMEEAQEVLLKLKNELNVSK